MIGNKKDLIYYIQQDRKMNGYPAKRRFNEVIKSLFFPSAVTYLRYLRKLEYYTNVPSLTGKFMRVYYDYKIRISARKLGYYIGINSCGSGLSLPHYGTVIISAEARLGKNCRVHVCVNIGRSAGGKKAPQIGDNVYIGPSCVLFGDIKIASNVTIGANATVNKSVEQEHVIIAGTPAKIIKTDYPSWIEFNKE
ncbi:serine acetyltransferase [Bacteroides xylanisolvens]|uniref:serine O-acetyltransferase n=1 Tax=Bacteroides xylanisolvens TaxID=371601 RepID=UPI001CDD2151|nr:serine acetyltransferase [Bacteroides xylanisolvens]MCA4563333.1 serine acetyltransferase [Bacteroides xylanisolvens]